MSKKGPRYHLAFRRRREGKTDFYRREGLLKSGKTRLAVRTTLSKIITQFIDAKPEGDWVIASSTSRELARDFGWKAGLGNQPAAYLAGLLAGLRAKANGLTEAIVDSGIKKPHAGSKIYAAVKGVKDSGVHVSCDESVLPNENRINGIHIAEYSKSFTHPKEKSYHFSEYRKNSLAPEELPKHFAEVKLQIVRSFKT